MVKKCFDKFIKLLTIVLISCPSISVAESRSIPLRFDNFCSESCFCSSGSLRLLILTLFLLAVILLSVIKWDDGMKLYFSYSWSSLSRAKCPNNGTSQVTVLFESIFLKKCVTNLAKVAINLTTVVVVAYLFWKPACWPIRAAATCLAISYWLTKPMLLDILFLMNWIKENGNW